MIESMPNQQDETIPVRDDVDVVEGGFSEGDFGTRVGSPTSSRKPGDRGLRPGKDSESELNANHQQILAPVKKLIATIRHHFCGPLENTDKRHCAVLIKMRIRSMENYES
ncbi:hypothetical protein U1Q18_015456 [Sarracenia purpurea var. burkii]